MLCLLRGVGLYTFAHLRAARMVAAWALVIAAFAPMASAQEIPPRAEPSAEERQAAADAFDRGTRAYLARDYARAAEWFETAYRMAPASAALIQAIRAHERAGDRVRAATLALRLTVNYPTDRAAMRQAESTLVLASELVRVDVGCARHCTIELDGTLMELASFFLEPGGTHVVRATFDTGTVEERISGAAGEVRALRIEAPTAPVVAETPAAEPGRLPEPDAQRTSGPVVARGGGLTPALGLIGVGLTAAAGAVLIWSGIDTLAGVDPYRMDPTPARLADGQSRELRTNVLIGVTAGLALASAIFLLVADWSGASADLDAPAAEPSLTAVIAPIDAGVIAAMRGSF